MEILTGSGSLFEDMDGFVAHIQCSLVEGLREGGMGKGHRFDIFDADRRSVGWTKPSSISEQALDLGPSFIKF